MLDDSHGRNFQRDLGIRFYWPGPLILVNEFVGFLAAFREGGLRIAKGTPGTAWVWVIWAVMQMKTKDLG